MDIIAGGDVHYGDGKKAASQFKATYYGIYFGAHWAPPCRLFTTTLSEFYKDVNKDANSEFEKPFEVLFVSLDGNHEAFLRNFREMPWLGVSCNEETRVSALKQKFGINGIPTLVITNLQGELISYDGRKDIQDGAEAALKLWGEKVSSMKGPAQQQQQQQETQINTN